MIHGFESGFLDFIVYASDSTVETFDLCLSKAITEPDPIGKRYFDKHAIRNALKSFMAELQGKS